MLYGCEKSPDREEKKKEGRKEMLYLTTRSSHKKKEYTSNISFFV